MSSRLRVPLLVAVAACVALAALLAESLYAGAVEMHQAALRATAVRELMAWSGVAVLLALVALLGAAAARMLSRPAAAESDPVPACMTAWCELPDAVVCIDEDGRIGAFNAASERLFGYSADEIAGANVSVLMPSPDSEHHAGYLSAYLATGQRRMIGSRREVIARRRDGSVFPVEISVSELRVGGRRLFCAVLRDVIAERQADDAIRGLARLSHENPAPVLRVARDGRLLYANEASIPLLRDWDAEVGEKLPRYWRGVVRDVLETGRIRELEHAYDDTILSLRCVGFPQSGYVNVYASDVTRAKEVARELQRAKEEAEAASRLKTEFLANMSHEIRTPMTAILGYTDLLRETQQSTAEREQSLKIIRRNGEHLLAVINDILDLSKIEAGRMDVESVPFNPWLSVNEVISLVRPRAEAKGITLDVICDGPTPSSIRSDPVRLRQILINLLGNAVKFTRRGGVRLVMKLASDPGEQAPLLRFDVVDTGIGMSPEELSRLFHPFVQADSSTTRRFGGTGLGLAISKRLAERLGGDIRVKSRRNEGSVFSLTLATGPLESGQLVQSPQTQPESHEVCEDEVDLGIVGGRVLLAEDGRDNQRLIRAILRREGLEVDLAEDGVVACEKALGALAAQEPYDVVLMDMQMPELDGYGATSRLREAGYTGAIIALTAHAMGGDRERCLAAGCNDFATKPLERRRLMQLIAQFIAKERDA